MAIGADAPAQSAEEIAGLPPDTGPIETISKVRHSVSAKTRQLMAEAIKKLSASEDEDDLEPAIAAKTDLPPAGGGAVPPTAPSPPAALPEDVARMRSDLEARGKEFEARERALAERERAADLVAFRDTWIQKGPIEALRALLQGRGIVENDADWKDAAAELVAELSAREFGAQIDPTMRNAIDVRRARREASWTRKTLAEREADAARRADETRAEQQWTAARDAIGRELGRDDRKALYPFLSALDNPGDLVMEWIGKESKAGKTLSWQEAAKAANDYVQDQVATLDKRWRPLLEKLAGRAVGTSAQAPGRPPGTSQVTPPPKSTQTPSQPQAVKIGDRGWNERHRQETKRKMRAAFRPGQ